MSVSSNKLTIRITIYIFQNFLKVFCLKWYRFGIRQNYFWIFLPIVFKYLDRLFWVTNHIHLMCNLTKVNMWQNLKYETFKLTNETLLKHGYSSIISETGCSEWSIHSLRCKKVLDIKSLIPLPVAFLSLYFCHSAFNRSMLRPWVTSSSGSPTNGAYEWLLAVFFFFGLGSFVVFVDLGGLLQFWHLT